MELQEAISVLKQGGIVIFPTDTAFGVGCRIDDEKAIQRLFAIRKRPTTQATSILVDTVKMAQDYLEPIPEDVIEKLIEPYWPGALTIVLSCLTQKVPLLVRGGTSTLGVRIPNHPIARALVRGVGKPILGPSANFHGEETAYSVEELNPELVILVDGVVRGACTIKQASTVIDCTQKPWKVLREGPVKIELRIKNYELRIQRKKTLKIDTASNQYITVGLQIGDREFWKREPISSRKSQVTLRLIDELLQEYTCKPLDLTDISVNEGPGSFTGLRVGAAIANAFGFVLQIKVNGKKQIVEPKYE